MPTNRDRDKRKATERAEREEQFKDIEESLARASDLIGKSKIEIARSQQLMKGSDVAQDKADKERDDANRP